jgi:hypothetical protein
VPGPIRTSRIHLAPMEILSSTVSVSSNARAFETKFLEREKNTNCKLPLASVRHPYTSRLPA